MWPSSLGSSLMLKHLKTLEAASVLNSLIVETMLIRTEDQGEHFSLITVRVVRRKAVGLSAHREKVGIFREGMCISRNLVEN